MTITEEFSRISKYDNIHTRALDLRHLVRDTYTRAQDIETTLNALQARVTELSTAQPGTVDAELYATYLGLFPTNLNSYLIALRTAALDLQTAVENADVASGGEWFGVTQ